MSNRITSKNAAAATLRLLVLLVACVCFAVAPSCGTADHQPPESVGSSKAELKAATFASSQSLFGRTACDTSRNIETATAVMSPGVNNSCLNGRAFFSFATSQHWLQEASLSCLANPGICSTNCAANPNSCVRQRQLSDPTIMNMAVNFPQTINTGVGLLGACTNTSTAPTYVTAGNDTWMVRSGSKLFLLIAGTRRKTEPCIAGNCVGCGDEPVAACQPEQANNVNFLLVSTDCGNTWTPSKLIDNGNGSGSPAIPNTPCGNLDFFRMYVDPYKTSPSGHKYIYIMALGGDECCGGVDYNQLYRSGDGGSTFEKKWEDLNVHGFMGITSFPDGTTVLFGCSTDTMGSPPHKGPRALWSSGNDDTSFFTLNGPSLPDCATHGYFGNIFKHGPDLSTISRVTNPGGSYNYFRFGYQHFTGNVNAVILGYGAVPSFGSQAAPQLVQTGTIPVITPLTDIFRASFIDPDPPNATSPPSATSVLYWEEINSSGQHNIRYSVATGLTNYTPSRQLNLNASNPEPWLTTFPLETEPGPNQGKKWGGEYDKGSFWYDPTSTSSINVLNYLAQWTQSHTCTAPAQPSSPIHYNRVQVTEPRFTESEPFAQTNGRSTDPGAAKLVTSGGVTQIHLIAADGGVIQRAIYSDNTQSWTGWTNVGNVGVTSRSAAAVSWATGRLDVFAIGTDSQMYHYAEQNLAPLHGGSGWTSIGAPSGGFIEGPSVTSAKANHLFVVGIGQGGAVYYKTYTGCCGGGWSGWQPLAGGVANGTPAAFSMTSNRLDVIARATDNYLWQYVAWDDNTAGWEGRGSWFQNGGLPGLAASPAVAVRDSSRIDVFAGDRLNPYIAGQSDTSGHSQIMHAWYDNGWSDWHNIGTILCGTGPSCAGVEGSAAPHTSIAAVALSPTRVRVFHRGLNQHIWWSVHNN